MNVDPSKSTVQYDYKKLESKVLKSIQLAKFKKDKGDLIDTPHKASILFDKKTKSVYFVVQANTTHTHIFTGLLIPSKSYARILNSKSENIEVLAFEIEKKEKKLASHVIKIQISSEEDEKAKKEFFEVLQEAIEGKVEEKTV